ncbi:MAG: DUF3179 domain-containing protein [Bacteroidetes bacterium]|jgi:hypothetical protein|nr:DUF3179 domain-containing protein [Bacteroidota bacterium]
MPFRCLLLLIPLLAFLVAPANAQDLDSWETDWSNRSIDLDELQSGGVPRDGIPSIDDPSFVEVYAASAWLKDQEPVLALDVNGVARAYPLQIMTWHEIVNDEIGGVPVAVTFCPLCYSAIAFDRRVGGRTLTFGVSGLLRHSDLVMYDRQTESLWQQLNGKAIVGDLTGKTLEALPAQLISFAQFREAHPNGEVLSRETGYDRRYGQNPYAGYDDIDKQPFLYRGPTDGRVPPMEKVVTVSLDGADKAYPYSITRERRVIHDAIAGQPVVVFHADGAVSALDRSTIHRSKETGSTGVFDPRVDDRTLRFEYADGRFVDAQTGSTWTITGKAIDGRLEGKQLEPIPHGDFFSFAWFAFKPDAELYEPGGTGSR